VLPATEAPPPPPPETSVVPDSPAPFPPF
jgi:hypothetical protein